MTKCRQKTNGKLFDNISLQKLRKNEHRRKYTKRTGELKR